MRSGKQKSVSYLAIDEMRFGGRSEGGELLIACVPILGFRKKFGFMCTANELRELALGLLRLADAVIAHDQKKAGAEVKDGT